MAEALAPMLPSGAASAPACGMSSACETCTSGASLCWAQLDRDVLKEKVDRETCQLSRAEQACKQLIKGQEWRVAEARRVREDVHQEVNRLFNKFLKRRRHSGKIKIDYNDHELEMEVAHQRCRMPAREGCQTESTRLLNAEPAAVCSI